MYGENSLKRRLTDPPRDLSWGVTTQLLFGGVISFFGWFFLGFGMIFFWIFALNCDLPSWWRFRGNLETARGKLTAVEKTSFSEGGSEHSDGTPVYAYTYRFAYGGQDYEGTSYRLGTHAEMGSDVTVEFPSHNPKCSRIQGYRAKPFAPWAGFVVIFPAVGLAIVLGRTRLGLKRRYLLKYGELTTGRLVAKERTNTEINDQPVYRLTFEFETTMGHTAQMVVKTHNVRPLEDDERETLLYDPTHPTYGTTLDHLPGRPRIHDDGTIGVNHTRAAFLSLIVPGLTIVGHGTYVLLRYVLP